MSEARRSSSAPPRAVTNPYGLRPTGSRFDASRQGRGVVVPALTASDAGSGGNVSGQSVGIGSVGNASHGASNLGGASPAPVDPSRSSYQGSQAGPLPSSVQAVAGSSTGANGQFLSVPVASSLARLASASASAGRTARPNRSESYTVVCNVSGCSCGGREFTGQRKAADYVSHLYSVMDNGMIDQAQLDRYAEEGNGGNCRACPDCRQWTGSIHYLTKHREQRHMHSRARVAAPTTISSPRSPSSPMQDSLRPLSAAVRNVLRDGARRVADDEAPAPRDGDPINAEDDLAVAAFLAPRVGPLEDDLGAEDDPASHGAQSGDDVNVSQSTSISDIFADVPEVNSRDGGESDKEKAAVELAEEIRRANFTPGLGSAGQLRNASLLAQLLDERGAGNGTAQVQRGAAASPRSAVGAHGQGNRGGGGPDGPPNPDGDGGNNEDGEEEGRDDSKHDDIEEGGAAAVDPAVDPSSVLGEMSELLRRKTRWLGQIPRDVGLRRQVLEIVRKLLTAILDASGPASFFRAWKAIFRLPREIFALSSRGGKEHQSEAKQINAQVDVSIRRYLSTNRNIEGQYELSPVAPEEDVYEDEFGRERGEVDPIARQIAKAKSLAARGHLSRAFSELGKRKLPAVTTEVYEAIREAFVDGDLSDLPAMPSTVVSVSAGETRDAIKKTCNGGAPGPSGWHGDLAKVFLDDESIVELYGQALVTLVNKREWITRELSQLVLGARVIAFEKPAATLNDPSTYRPICVSEMIFQHLQIVCLRKIPGKVMEDLFREQDISFQHSVGENAGIEKAVHKASFSLELAADEEAEYVFGTGDKRGAYQFIQRKPMMEALIAEPDLKCMYGVTELAMTWAAPRYIRMSDGTVNVFYQTRGGAQGWVAMPLWYALGEKKTLLDSLNPPRNPETEPLCTVIPRTLSTTYADDAGYTARPARALEIHRRAIDMYGNLGLEHDINKCKVVLPHKGAIPEDLLSEFEETGMTVTDGTKFLGAFLSTDPKLIREYAEKKIGIHSAYATRIFNVLRHPKLDAQLFLLFVTQSVQHWFDYHARVFPPSILESIAQSWDNALLELVVAKLGRSEMSRGQHLPEWDFKLNLERQQMQLPVNHAGLGLRPLSIISLVAFLASLGACAKDIVSVCSRSELGGSQEEPRMPQRYVEEYAKARERLIEMAPKLDEAKFSEEDSPSDEAVGLIVLPPTLYEYLRNMQAHPSLAVKFQSRLSRFVWDAKLKNLKGELSEKGMVADLARLQAYSAAGAGRHLTLLPDGPKTIMSNKQMQQACRLQVGAMPAAWMYQSEGRLMCVQCGKVNVKDVPGHALHCPCVKRRIINVRHDTVAHIYEDAAERNRVPTSWTPFVDQADSQKTTDLAFHFHDQSLQVDFTIVSSDAPSKAASVGGSAFSTAMSATGTKLTKYAELVAQAGDVFVPVVYNAAGSYPRLTDYVLKRIAQAGEDNDVTNPATSGEIRRLVAIAIQRCNAIANMDFAASMRSKAPRNPVMAAFLSRRRNRARAMAAGNPPSAGSTG